MMNKLCLAFAGILALALILPIGYSEEPTPANNTPEIELSGMSLKIDSPQNNSVIAQNSVLLSLSTDKYAACSYSIDNSIFTGLQDADQIEVTLPPGIEVEGDAWQISEGNNHFELSEDGSITDTIETIRNITTYIDKSNSAALSSGSVANAKTTSPYNQYLYLLGPGAETSLDTGYVIYSENDEDTTADFLYFKSGREIGRYLLEFTTPFESGVYDSTGLVSTTGLFLTDYEDVEIAMFGKKYTIVTARRTSTAGNDVMLTLMSGAAKDTLMEGNTKTYEIDDKLYEVTLNFVDDDEAQFIVNSQTTRKMKQGDTDKLIDSTTIGVTDVLYQDYAGGVHSATFFLGVGKIEMKDTNIKDAVSSNSLKVNDDTIDDAHVIIEGSDDNSTFKINRIHVNMTADDNYFVPAGGKLSDTIRDEGGSSAEPEVLFTQNWDIEYLGLKKVNTEKIALKTSGTSQYNLEFVDGDGNKVSVPIAKADAASTLLFGDTDKDFVNRENSTITKDDYLVVTDGTRKRGERKTYILQYKGADKVTAGNPILKFKDLGSGETIEQMYSGGTGGGAQQLATLKIGGADFKIFNNSAVSANDFDVLIDLDASGSLNTNPNATVNITTMFGAEIGLTNTTDINVNTVILSVKTPDALVDGNAKDFWENVRPSDYVVNISADSSTKIAHSEINGFTSGQKGQKLSTRTPDGKTNVAYGYTSYGAFITRETPLDAPAIFEIDYPESQRYPQAYITTKGAAFTETGPETIIIENSKRKWRVGTSNHLELSEDGISTDSVETLRNITTYIDKSNLQALDSGTVKTNKSTSPYNQYLYLLGPGTENKLESGYVIYAENDRDITADFLYFKSGREIGRYLLELTTPLESGIYNVSGTQLSTGLWLKDFEGVNITLLGKKFTIVNASRTSADGNGVKLILDGDNRLELEDTNIRDVASTNNLKSNDNSIDGTYVIVEGTDDNSTFKISRIHVNMTADDDFYVASGSRLSESIMEEGSEPDVLFTQNWDIAYLGLSDASTQKIKLANNDLNQYALEFVDGDGNPLSLPIATSQGNDLLMGDSNQPFINSEVSAISKDAYFVLTDASRRRGSRKSFILQYLGADNITSENPSIRFRNLGTGQIIEQAYSNSSPIAALSIDGSNYQVYAADSPAANSLLSDNFGVIMDLNGDSKLNDKNVAITAQFGAEINITNQTGGNSILLSITTPDESRGEFAKDSVENLYPSVLIFNISANNGMVNHAKLGNLNFRTPDGQDNVEYAYTTYGTFITREVPLDKPATLDIDYPSSQRLPLVYYETGSPQSKLLENLTEGQHSISIKCKDIFGSQLNRELAFSFVNLPASSPPDSGSGNSGGGGSGGGGGGGGGGGAGAFNICNEEWECSDWSECISGAQSRECNLVKVPQHTQSEECPAIEDAPETGRRCEAEESPQNSDNGEGFLEENNLQLDEQQNLAAQNPQGLEAITGAATGNGFAESIEKILGNPKAVKELVAGALILLLGIGTYFYFYKPKTKKKISNPRGRI